MPNTYSLPATMTHDQNGNITVDSLHRLTFFSLGDVKPEHGVTDQTTPWGWLSPALTGHTNSLALPSSVVTFGGNRILSPSNIRPAFEGIEIRRRGSRYLANTGRIDYWRDWEFCSSADPAKQTLGLATIFDMVRRSPEREFIKYRAESVSGCAPDGSPFYIPERDVHRYPLTTVLNSKPGRALGDSDNTLELEYFGDNKLYENAAAIRAFNGEQHSVAVGNIMRNTGFAVSQSRDVIEQFALAHVARNKNVAVTSLAANDPDVAAARVRYNEALLGVRNNPQLTGHITNDIAALRANLADATKCPANSPQHDVTRQILTEYEALHEGLNSLRNNPQIKDLASFQFIHGDTLTPDMLMQLNYWPQTKNLFFNVNPDRGQNAGFLLMTRFSGFNDQTLNTLWNPADNTAASNLSRSLRFMGTHRWELMQQGLFNPNDVGEHRDAVVQSMVDLPGMIRTLLVPGAADLPENAAYLSTAYRAQFVSPQTNTMRRRVAMQRLATAFDNGSDYVHIDHLKWICDAMGTGTYDPKLANIGITRSDFTEIRDLLVAGLDARDIPRQMSTLLTGFTELMDKHGHDKKYMDKSDFLMASSAIQINYHGPEVNFCTLDGQGQRSGHSVSVFQQNTHYGHAATLAMAQRARARQDALEPFTQQLALGGPRRPGGLGNGNLDALCLAPFPGTPMPGIGSNPLAATGLSVGPAEGIDRLRLFGRPANYYQNTVLQRPFATLGRS